MSIVDEVVKNILKETRYFVGIGLDEEWDGESSIQVTGRCREYEGMVEKVLGSEEDILGLYEPMRSPGRINLFEERLASFFWGLLSQISRKNYYLETADLGKMIHMVVLKTYTHEQFHHFADVARHLLGGQYDRNLEEALAVAWSRQKLNEKRKKWQSSEARLSAPLYNELMINMYQYSSTGYRDWVLYQSEDEFMVALSSYLGGSGRVFLEQSGVSVGNVLLKILDEVKDKGVVEIIR